MLLFEQGWNGGAGWILSGDGLVMLESAKVRILGVDTQDNTCHHVPGIERFAY
jgi:hypothetical protein